MNKKLDANLFNNAQPIPFCGCLIWMYCIHKSGYGQFRENGKPIRAHRRAYELVKGPIPEGMFVLHRCDTPSCINPDHLFLGNQHDNIHDALSKGRMNNGNNRKQFCRHGHPFNDENTRLQGTHRRCRECDRQRFRRWWWKNKDKINSRRSPSKWIT